MFGATNEQLPEGNKFITPGIQKVQITDLKNTDSGYFELYLKLDGAKDEDAKAFRFYTSEKALSLNMNKLYEIIRAVDPSLESIVAENLGEYIAKIKPKLVNRKYQQLFTGKQNRTGGPFFPEIPLSRRTKEDTSPTIACSYDSEPSFEFDEAKHLTPFETPTSNLNENVAQDWE